MSEFEKELRESMANLGADARRRVVEERQKLIEASEERRRQLDLVREEVYPILDELMPELGKARWGEGNFTYAGSGGALIGPSPEPGANERFSIFLHYDDEGPYLLLDSPITSTATIQRAYGYIDDYKVDFVSKVKPGGGGYYGLIIARQPFNRELVTALIKSAAVIGPRTLYYSGGGRHYVGEGNH